MRAFRVLMKVGARMPFNIDDLSPVAEKAWEQLALALLTSDGGDFLDHTEEEMAAILEPLGWLWILPLAAFGTWERQTYRDFDSYFIAMYHALSLALPNRGDGDPKAAARFLRRIQSGMEEMTVPVDGTDARKEN